MIECVDKSGSSVSVLKYLVFFAREYSIEMMSCLNKCAVSSFSAIVLSFFC